MSDTPNRAKLSRRALFSAALLTPLARLFGKRRTAPVWTITSIDLDAGIVVLNTTVPKSEMWDVTPREFRPSSRRERPGVDYLRYTEAEAAYRRWFEASRR